MANTRRPSPAKNVKALITALSIVATAGGWAAISQQGVSTATASSTGSLAQATTSAVAPTSTTVTTVSRQSTTVSSATAPVAVTRTRSSR